MNAEIPALLTGHFLFYGLFIPCLFNFFFILSSALRYVDLRAFLSIIRKCTDLKELTPERVNRLITKIEIFDSTKDENGKKHVPIKVHFVGVGVIIIPDGKTILETYEAIRKNPPKVA